MASTETWASQWYHTNEAILSNGPGVVDTIYQQLRRVEQYMFFSDGQVAFGCFAEDQVLYYLMNLKIHDVWDFEALEVENLGQQRETLYGTGGRYFYSEGFNVGRYGFGSYLCGLILPVYRREHFSQVPYG